MNKYFKIKINNNSGFVSILAVLLVSLMLVMLIGITQNSYKEFSLSSFAKESKYAFFAADTGMECAQYQDNREMFAQGSLPSLKCATKSLGLSPYNDGTDFKTVFQFDMNVGKANGVNRTSCVKVIVQKNFEYTPPGESDPASFTKIQSFGYNKSCAIVDAGVDKSIVERALRMLYANPVIVANP